MPNPSSRPAWFVGDLDDPWVEAIAAAVPGGMTRVAAEGDWHEALARELPPAATLVIHRAVLTGQDAERLARLRRDRASSLRVILCVGPHVRHSDLLRWSTLVDVVLPEATARETIARHVREGGRSHAPDSDAPRHRVAVVSRNFELRQALADACGAAGYPVRDSADWLEPASGLLTVWDVPVLEPDWSRTLGRHSRQGIVVALLGFADRALVREARANGASACLDLPCDPADLIEVLDRLAAARTDPVHEVPPPPWALRRGPRTVAGAGGEPYN